MEEKVSQVAEVIEREYENPFRIHVNKDKLVIIISGVALNDDLQKVYCRKK